MTSFVISCLCFVLSMFPFVRLCLMCANFPLIPHQTILNQHTLSISYIDCLQSNNEEGMFTRQSSCMRLNEDTTRMTDRAVTLFTTVCLLLCRIDVPFARLYLMCEKLPLIPHHTIPEVTHTHTLPHKLT